MRRLLREPLLHFLALAVLLLAGQAFLGPALSAVGIRGTVHVTAADVQRLRAEWRRKNGRPPDAETLRGLIDTYVDDQLLLHEARRLGLHRSDPVVRQWLIRSMRFANPDTSADDAALLDKAHAMGLAGHDPVVRRRLLARMRQRIKSRAQVTEDELDAYLETHRDRFALARRYRFRQVFFSRDKRGTQARRDAAAALSRLRGARPPDPGQLGDAFQLGARFPSATRSDIKRRFGAAFAERVSRAPIDAWIGPVTSAYGLHLLRVAAVSAGGQPTQAAMRPRAVARLYRKQENDRLRMALTRLREHYRIRIDAGPSVSAGAAAP